MAAPGAQGAFGKIITINTLLVDSDISTDNSKDNILNLLNHYIDYAVIKAFFYNNGSGGSNYTSELTANNSVRNMLGAALDDNVRKSDVFQLYTKYIYSIISLSINSKPASIVNTKILNTVDLYKISDHSRTYVPVITMLKLGINNLKTYSDNNSSPYPELDGGITTKTFLDLVNKFNFFGTFFATTDAHFGNIMFTNKFIQELNIIDLGLARDVFDVNSVRLSANTLHDILINKIGFDNFAIEDLIHQPNVHTKGQIVDVLVKSHNIFRTSCRTYSIWSPYFPNNPNAAHGDLSCRTTMNLIYDEFTALDYTFRHYVGMRTKDLYIFGIWILYNKRDTLFSNPIIMEIIGALLMHPNPLLRPNTRALRKLLDQVIKPSRHTVNINVTIPGTNTEYRLCTVENRIEGTVNINISNLLANIAGHVPLLFHENTIKWNTISYTSLIVQIYSILNQPGGVPRKNTGMIIDKITHLRVEGNSFEYTVESMRNLVNNIRLDQLTNMETSVITFCRDEVKKTQPWLVNEGSINNTFIENFNAWYPVQAHNGPSHVIIGNPGVMANFDP